MYKRTNPAIIKSILLRMNQIELIEEIQYIKTQIESLQPGNRKRMFIKLYQFAVNHYPNAKK
jgi:hypothetical protein